MLRCDDNKGEIVSAAFSSFGPPPPKYRVNFYFSVRERNEEVSMSHRASILIVLANPACVLKRSPVREYRPSFIERVYEFLSGNFRQRKQIRLHCTVSDRVTRRETETRYVPES